MPSLKVLLVRSIDIRGLGLRQELSISRTFLSLCFRILKCILRLLTITTLMETDNDNYKGSEGNRGRVREQAAAFLLQM